MIENEGIAESGGFKNWALDQTTSFACYTIDKAECVWFWMFLEKGCLKNWS